MITFDIQLNGVTVKKQIPSSWNDLTFEQYLNILKLTQGNEVDILSMLTGIEKDIILKAKITGLDDLLVVLDFMKTVPDFQRSNKLLGRDMPEDITFHALAPYIDCRQILFEVQNKDVAEFTEAYARYCAIYCQAVDSDWTGYDHDKAMLLVPEVMQSPASEVVGWGSFFITKLLRLKNSTEKNSPEKVTPRKKSKRVTKS
jgi:hypothetical protein